MAKMSELDMIVKELRAAAQAIITAADNFAAFFSGKLPEVSEAQESQESQTSENEVGMNEPEVAPITNDELLEVCRAKTAANKAHTKTIKTILGKYDSPNVTALPQEKRAAFKAEVEALK